MPSNSARACYCIRFVELKHSTINNYSNRRKNNYKSRTETNGLLFAQCFAFNYENGKAEYSIGRTVATTYSYIAQQLNTKNAWNIVYIYRFERERKTTELNANMDGMEVDKNKIWKIWKWSRKNAILFKLCVPCNAARHLCAARQIHHNFSSRRTVNDARIFGASLRKLKMKMSYGKPSNPLVCRYAYGFPYFFIFSFVSIFLLGLGRMWGN